MGRVSVAIQRGAQIVMNGRTDCEGRGAQIVTNGRTDCHEWGAQIVMNGAHRLSRMVRTGVAGKAGRTPGSYVSLSLPFRQSLQNQAVLPQFHFMHTCLLRATLPGYTRELDTWATIAKTEGDNYARSGVPYSMDAHSGALTTGGSERHSY
jgi:hypothetical protein